MNCLICGRENTDDAQTCASCGVDLVESGDVDKRVNVRTSKLAVASCVFGVVSFLAVPLAVLLRFPFPSPVIRVVVAVAPCICAILAVFLGVIGLVCIERSGGRVTGRGFVATGLAIPAVLFFLGVFQGAFVQPRRSVAYRLYCGTNLSGMGKAMLTYANDYDDELPRAGGPSSVWGATPNWKAEEWRSAYGCDTRGNGGRASISASLYLLVKYAEAEPKSFLCKGDIKTTEFVPAKYGVGKRDLFDLWDFGPDPAKHCSYTYHIPYGPYPLTTGSEPEMAVAGGRNPWLDTPTHRARGAKDFAAFDPNGTREAVKLGNALTHQEDGQNVLFMDGHATFEKTSACGVKDDNIYTSWAGSDIRKGAPPTLTSQPASRFDSLLVHDRPAGDDK